MNKDKYQYYQMGEASTVNAALDNLPVAEEMRLWATKDNDIENLPDAQYVGNFKTIRVKMPDGTKQFVHCPKNRYHAVQHKVAMRPIIEGMTLAGIKDFRHIFTWDAEKAEMWVFPNNDEVADSVQLGFNVTNSFNGRKAIHFGFELGRGKEYIELVSWREVCSNGAKIRVPLGEGDFVTLERRQEIEKLLAEQTRIIHTKRAPGHLETMQYVVEAISLLYEPVSRMIEAAQGLLIEDEQRLKEMIKYHVGKRYGQRVIEQYNEDGGNSLWDLFNAMTASASHHSDLSKRSRDTLLNKAANMLMVGVTQ